eukprot:350692-Chlamydomonas_euryale.AAC.5
MQPGCCMQETGNGTLHGMGPCLGCDRAGVGFRMGARRQPHMQSCIGVGQRHGVSYPAGPGARTGRQCQPPRYPLQVLCVCVAGAGVRQRECSVRKATCIALPRHPRPRPGLQPAPCTSTTLPLPTPAEPRVTPACPQVCMQRTSQALFHQAHLPVCPLLTHPSAYRKSTRLLVARQPIFTSLIYTSTHNLLTCLRIADPPSNAPIACQPTCLLCMSTRLLFAHHPGHMPAARAPQPSARPNRLPGLPLAGGGLAVPPGAAVRLRGHAVARAPCVHPAMGHRKGRHQVRDLRAAVPRRLHRAGAAAAAAAIGRHTHRDVALPYGPQQPRTAHPH